MKQIVITNVPDDAHASLKREAKANFRTLGQHVLALAFQAAGVARPLPSKKPARKRGTTIRKGERV